MVVVVVTLKRTPPRPATLNPTSTLVLQHRSPTSFSNDVLQRRPPTSLSSVPLQRRDPTPNHTLQPVKKLLTRSHTTRTRPASVLMSVYVTRGATTSPPELPTVWSGPLLSTGLRVSILRFVVVSLLLTSVRVRLVLPITGFSLRPKNTVDPPTPLNVVPLTRLSALLASGVRIDMTLDAVSRALKLISLQFGREPSFEAEQQIIR